MGQNNTQNQQDNLQIHYFSQADYQKTHDDMLNKNVMAN